jgi:hypothetical protein
VFYESHQKLQRSSSRKSASTYQKETEEMPLEPTKHVNWSHAAKYQAPELSRNGLVSSAPEDRMAPQPRLVVIPLPSLNGGFAALGTREAPNDDRQAAGAAEAISTSVMTRIADSTRKSPHFSLVP